MPAQTGDRGFLNGVRTYYDKNTPRFVRSHQSAVAKAIHREVWGPGVQTEKEAFEYVNALVLRAISNGPVPGLSPLPVLDLGCGVGGTLFYLAARMPIAGIGITLSPVGVRLAERLADENGLAGQCRFMEANYLELPDVGPRQDRLCHRILPARSRPCAVFPLRWLRHSPRRPADRL